MISIKLYHRQSTVGTNGTVYVHFYINRKRVNFSTEVKCDLKDWSEKNQRVKSSDKQHADKNIILSNISSRINNVFVKFRLKDKSLTRDLFFKYYNRPDDFDTFHDFCTDYKKKSYKIMSGNTTRMHDSVLKKLQEYKPELHFDDINKEMLDHYEFYLKREKDNNDNTVNKNMSVLKKYVYAAIRAGYMESNPFDEYKVKQGTTDIVFLEEDELKRLYKGYVNWGMDEKYRSTYQVFLYMCFGSQHIGDARQMRIEQFGEKNYTYYRVKMLSRKPMMVTVPISNALRSIINEIAGDRKKGKLFEKLPADQTMNRYLEDIANYAKIKKDITLKTGRHTFGTVFLEYNPNIRTLQDIMGHSDFKTTMMYAHALKKAKQKGIECFDKMII